VSNKADRKATKQESPVLHVDDDDLFAESKPKVRFAHCLHSYMLLSEREVRTVGY
jgi:hypothetical protein